jgi:hypothetical protein
MKKVIRLTESDLTRIVKRVIKEQAQQTTQAQTQQTAQVSAVQKCVASIKSKPQSCLNNDAGNCIKDLGRMVTNSDPSLVLPFAEAVRCLTPLITKA